MNDVDFCFNKVQQRRCARSDPRAGPGSKKGQRMKGEPGGEDKRKGQVREHANRGSVYGNDMIGQMCVACARVEKLLSKMGGPSSKLYIHIYIYIYEWHVCPSSYNLKSEMNLRERVWREIWKEVGRR